MARLLRIRIHITDIFNISNICRVCRVCFRYLCMAWWDIDCLLRRIIWYNNSLLESYTPRKRRLLTRKIHVPSISPRLKTHGSIVKQRWRGFLRRFCACFIQDRSPRSFFIRLGEYYTKQTYYKRKQVATMPFSHTSYFNIKYCSRVYVSFNIIQKNLIFPLNESS